jgi:hypothetical protein
LRCSVVKTRRSRNGLSRRLLGRSAAALFRGDDRWHLQRDRLALSGRALVVTMRAIKPPVPPAASTPDTSYHPPRQTSPDQETRQDYQRARANQDGVVAPKLLDRRRRQERRVSSAPATEVHPKASRAAGDSQAPAWAAVPCCASGLLGHQQAPPHWVEIHPASSA